MLKRKKKEGRRMNVNAIEKFVRKLLWREPFKGEVYIAASEIGEAAFCLFKPALKFYLKEALGIDIVNESISRGKEIHRELYSGIPLSIDEIIEHLLIFKHIEFVELFLVRKINGVRLVGRVDKLAVKIGKKGTIMLEIHEGKSTQNDKFLRAINQYDLPFSWKLQALAYKLLSNVEYDGKIRRSVILEVINNRTGEIVDEIRIKNIDKLLPYFMKTIEELLNPELIVANKYLDRAKHLCSVCSAREYCKSIKEEEVIDFWIARRLKPRQRLRAKTTDYKKKQKENETDIDEEIIREVEKLLEEFGKDEY